MKQLRWSEGFTLIELLVVLAVFGLLSVILADGFRFSERVIDTGMTKLDRASDLALTANFIRARFADIRPLPAGNGMVSFDGKPDSVDFIGATPAYQARNGLQSERISVEARGGKRDLVFRAGPHSAPSILAEGIASSYFGYFGELHASEGAQWHDRWDAASGLPSLIRLRVTFPDGSPSPDIVVAVRSEEAAFQ